MLSPNQIAARRGKLTASRIACLMTGDREAIMRLWLEMTDQAEPEDLRHVWPVRLGECTEPLSLDWYQEKNGIIVSRRGEVVQHPQYEWACATLDGWDETLRCPVEVKHCGGREPVEVLCDRYAPQTQWQMECTGAQQCALSIILGASEPIVEFLHRDFGYATEMIKRGRQFMQHVANRTPPVALDAVPPPADPSKIIDMSQDNRWCSEAFIWLESKPASDRCKDAEKILKAMVPENAKKCHGANIQITRDRAGRLSLREQTNG